MATPGKPTNFPNGVTSWDVPMLDQVMARAAAQNARVFWVDPRDGAGGGGKTVKNAFTTVTALNNAMNDETGDVGIFLAQDGTTGSSSRDTANIAWSNSGTTLIGACAPVHVSQRARIAPSTSFADPLMTVSGHNNVFANLQFFQGHNAASTCVTVSGDRNYFYNCHFAGIGHATAGDSASSETLLLDGGSENLFENCTIGLDTIARSAACAEIRCDNAATRNYFKNCRITGFADAAGALFLDIPGSGDIDRYIWFDNCSFFNPIDSTATTMTVAANIHASAGGTVVLQNCFGYGFTDWGSAFANIAQLAPASNEADASASMGLAINGD